MPSRHTTSLIVAERGSDWARWAERFRVGTPDVVVVLQRRGETAGQFALRVRARLEAIARSDAMLTHAVLVGGGRVDHDAISSRSLAIRAIASHMANGVGGEVVLHDAGPDRHSMAALAAAIEMLIHGTGVSVVHARTDTRVAA